MLLYTKFGEDTPNISSDIEWNPEQKNYQTMHKRVTLLAYSWHVHDHIKSNKNLQLKHGNRNPEIHFVCVQVCITQVGRETENSETSISESFSLMCVCVCAVMCLSLSLNPTDAGTLEAIVLQFIHTYFTAS